MHSPPGTAAWPGMACRERDKAALTDAFNSELQGEEDADG